jgi:hypothetical protein
MQPRSFFHCPRREERVTHEICRGRGCDEDCKTYRENFNHLPYILRLFIELSLEDMAGAMGPAPIPK